MHIDEYEKYFTAKIHKNEAGSTRIFIPKETSKRMGFSSGEFVTFMIIKIESEFGNCRWRSPREAPQNEH